MAKRKEPRDLISRKSVEPYSPKVDLGKDKVNLGPEQKRAPHVRDFTSAYTNALSLVSLILLIALIATVIIAASNPDNKERFDFFSPSKFLQTLSSETVVIPQGKYLCGFKGREVTILPYPIRATIVLPNGKVYLSDNRVNRFVVPYQDFVFTINGVQYYTEWREVADIRNQPIAPGWRNLGVVPILDVPETSTVDLMTMPDFGKVASAWENATLLDWPNALSATGTFLLDMLTYQANILSSILPWNTVASSDEVTDMEIPWRDEQNNYIQP